jgi:photosystem II stability/assembly factor-like uncharacterized protein
MFHVVKRKGCRFILITVSTIFLLFTNVSSQKGWHFRKQLPFVTIKSFSVVDSMCMYVVDFFGINKSTDGGYTWSRVREEFGIEYFKFLTRNRGILRQGLNDVKYSLDGGVTWNYSVYINGRAEVRFIDTLNGMTSQSDYISQARILKTTDGGVSWTAKYLGYAGGVYLYDQADSLIWTTGSAYVPSPVGPPPVENILKYSTDNGNTWIQHSRGGIETRTALEIMKSNVVVIVINKKDVRLSTDGGATFIDYPKTRRIYSPKTVGDTIIYCGADSGYIGWSRDYGVTFEYQKMNTNSAIQLLDVTWDGDVYAISDDNKLYSTAKLKPAPVDVEDVSTDLPEQFSLSQNYPNPFNPETVIRFALPEAGYVKGVVYDILGREVSYSSEWRDEFRKS